MKYTFTLLALGFLALSCNETPRALSSTDPVNWEKRKVTATISDTLDVGHTFLSIYSSIYMHNDQEQSDLTVTVSLHNPNRDEDVFIDKEGGTGANFIFDYKKRKGSNEPLFEAVMINTFGSQGHSFVTEGKRIK